MSSPEIEVVPMKKTAPHPKVSEMVNAAITTLAEPKGSSLHAIKKFISVTYDVDVKKLAVHIKKYLKTAVEREEMIQPKGKGACGSFKLSKPKAEVKPKIAGVKPKILGVKPRKKPILHTSTPKKSLKPKKAFAVYKSPVKKLKLVDEKQAPVDLALTKPAKKVVKKPRVSVPSKSRKSKVSLAGKVKKAKKLKAKKDEKTKAAVLTLKETVTEIVADPKPEKTADNSGKTKKSANPKKPAVSGPKKVVTK